MQVYRIINRKKFIHLHNEIYIIEKNKSFGLETSSRNSEVIHSGIYYPSDSLKSKLCIRGNILLYDYCISKNISFNRCGKYVIGQSNSDEKKLSPNEKR